LNLNLQNQVQALDALASNLTKATSIRDKVKLADRIFGTLSECESLVERFITTELAGTNGNRSRTQAKSVPQQGSHNADACIQTKRFRKMTLGQIGRMLLKERGVLHGKEIERLAKEGGYKSKGKHFQSSLATAFKREGNFENMGRNRWKLKEAPADTQTA
jgi:hypothetical protein